jgi:predicted negative regulator of RcsB-dependent stress response
VQLRLGEPNAAAATLQRIAHDTSALTTMLAGDVSFALGERRAAKASYEAALERANEAIAAQVRRRMARLASDPYR